jgi:hypothetical protein
VDAGQPVEAQQSTIRDVLSARLDLNAFTR